MNRTLYYDYIDEKLSTLSVRIKHNGKLNILSLHMHSENFYLHFFNLVYGLKLENLNTTLQNVEAIDLIDNTNKNIFQVSATSTKQKIESALSKQIMKGFTSYTFKFISIAEDSSKLRNKSYSNPYSVKFNPQTDIYDITLILKNILTFAIGKQKEVYEFIKEELGSELSIVNLDTNLASIINLISKEDLDIVNLHEEIDSFSISKKIDFNNLISSKFTIEEYMIYHQKVNEIYDEYDKIGNNKSNSVLASIRRIYLKYKSKLKSDEIFEKITEEVLDKIKKSSNFKKIPLDELELCIDILVVDAFIRCKIFENPEER